eukprot:TRINITY_DN11471_c0_g4_i1.p1 TRINITY_DN11471_c0_g4~~TRINITY_DN11471_c0_g4_i1.p1  ORF type:complete len:298 (+),score=50.48 TRINITY_DN11471_c0_g4_i1:101-994(+)
MVVAHRIAYIKRLMQSGTYVAVSVSVNPATQVQKFKVIIDEKTQVHPDHQICVQMVIELLASMTDLFCIADKGHRHSTGRSEVLFYLTPISQAASCAAQPAQCDSSRQQGEHAEENLYLTGGHSDALTKKGDPPGLGFQGPEGYEGSERHEASEGCRAAEYLQGSQAGTRQQLQQKSQPLKSILKKVPSRNVQAEQTVKVSEDWETEVLLGRGTSQYTAGGSEGREYVGGLEDRHAEGFQGSESFGNRRPRSEAELLERELAEAEAFLTQSKETLRMLDNEQHCNTDEDAAFRRRLS